MNTSRKERSVSTFSIVGYDPKSDELGIAVQSKFLGVGAIVPWAKAGVGAIATQSYANTSYGSKGLDLLARGKTAEETLALLINEDADRHLRQVGIVDAKGRAVSFTGQGCYEWAGSMTGHCFAVQGNLLVSEETVRAMAQKFVQTTGSLAERLLLTLEAGQCAGGDRRGKQSAALLIVKEKGGYGGFNDRLLDLRVDDHPEPIQELKRIFELQQLYFAKPKEQDQLPLTDDRISIIKSSLHSLGYLSLTQHWRDALQQFIATENLEGRMGTGTQTIDRVVFSFLQKKAKE